MGQRVALRSIPPSSRFAADTKRRHQRNSRIEETGYVAPWERRNYGRAVAATTAGSSSSFVRNRWVQLVAGIVGMVAVANLQYGWTLFVNPIDNAHHWGAAAIQVAYTTFILLETWLVPFEAYLVDRFGP